MPAKTDVKLSTISYIILYVHDTNKAVAFYRDTLGMTVKSDDEGWVELESGTTTLALHHEDNASPGPRNGSAVVVFAVEDILGAYEALKAKGVKFNAEPHQVCEAGDHVGKSADFTDPDGNALSIFGMVPR
jgi:catechol 2,3-dioxygenase-like lactoylglutathione lyase family enzyme